MSTVHDRVVLADSRRPGNKVQEKYNFTQTCNLLSQFLKEKRSSRALSLGMAGKVEPKATPVDLLANQENSDDALRQYASALDFLPQFVENTCLKQSDLRICKENKQPSIVVPSGTSDKIGTIQRKLASSPAITEPATPQLTIFYAGKVLVFDAFHPEKATEIMEMATKLSSDSASSGTNKNLSFTSVAAQSLNVVAGPETNTAQEVTRPGPQALVSDLRYPRRASLLKFLEKRKERVNARAPYQLNNPKHEGSISGGDPEDQSCKHLDLNL